MNHFSTIIPLKKLSRKYQNSSTELMQHGKDDIIFDTLVPEGSKDIGEGGKEGGGGKG